MVQQVLEYSSIWTSVVLIPRAQGEELAQPFELGVELARTRDRAAAATDVANVGPQRGPSRPQKFPHPITRSRHSSGSA